MRWANRSIAASSGRARPSVGGYGAGVVAHRADGPRCSTISAAAAVARRVASTGWSPASTRATVVPQNVSPAPVGSSAFAGTPGTSLRWSPWNTAAPAAPSVTNRSAPGRVVAPSTPPNSTPASSALQKNRSARAAVASTVDVSSRTALP